jgi:hypothetical protein
MATNPYFNNIRSKNEQNLLEDLVIESIKIHGMDMYYLPRIMVNFDRLYGEATISKFLEAKPIEMYLENVNGFSGEQDLLSKFGLEVRDNALFSVSKSRFQEETSMKRPMEGDLIYMPLTKGIFEITYVEHESPFYQLGKNYVFKIKVELFAFNDQEFSTGEPEIDKIAEDSNYYLFADITGASGSFAVDDLVYQYANGSNTGSYADADAKAKVIGVSGSRIKLDYIVGEWNKSDLFARYLTKSPTSYAQITDINHTVDFDDYDDNKPLETEADNTLNFNENNPFGSY